MEKFKKFEFEPKDGLRDQTAYPTTPQDEEEAREQVQRPMDQIRDHINNELQPSIKEEFDNADEKLENHKNSSDHDTRYFTRNQLNNGQLDNRYVKRNEIDLDTALRIVYEVFIIKEIHEDHFIYKNKDGDLIQSSFDEDGYQIFRLEKGWYPLEQNVISAYVNDTLHRSKASGGLKEINSTTVAIAPELEQTEITIQYFQIASALNPAILVSEEPPIHRFNGMFWCRVRR